MTTNYSELYKNADYLQLYKSLSLASGNGNLEEVKFLISCPELEKHTEPGNGNDYALIFAGYRGHINVVEYLLNLPAYGREDIQCTLFNACEVGQIELVNFLITSDTIPSKANIHHNEDEILYHALKSKNEIVLQYLIFDLQIELTDKLKIELSDANNPFYIQVRQWFENRNLNSELNNELINNNSSVNTKVKV
jgi:hypothetical protein